METGPRQAEYPGINFSTSEFRQNPYVTYAALRKDYPVYTLVDAAHYLINCDKDVRHALTTPSQFTSGIEAMVQPHWLKSEYHRKLFILSMDPPEHGSYKKLVRKTFSKEFLEQSAASVNAQADHFVSAIILNQWFDFPAQFAYPYIGGVINKIVGSEDYQDLELLRSQLAAREAVTPVRPSDAEVRAIEEAITQQNGKFSELISERRLHPRQDLISELLSARVDGDSLSNAELYGALDLFLSAGYHTSAQLLINAIIHLSQHPIYIEQLRQEPEQVPLYLEELLRLYSPTHFILRKAAQDILLHGTHIPAGAIVSLNVASANRDPNRFERPDEFILGRKANHLSFGAGTHFCIGAQLALLEIKTAVSKILSLFSKIKCPASDAIQWEMTMTGRIVRSLPVKFQK